MVKWSNLYWISKLNFDWIQLYFVASVLHLCFLWFDRAPYFHCRLFFLSLTIVYHYLPNDLHSLHLQGHQFFEGLEMSPTFLACFVQMYCQAGGVCLQMGCGTTPILKTCMKIGRVCASFDTDIFLINTYVEPLFLGYMQHKALLMFLVDHKWMMRLIHMKASIHMTSEAFTLDSNTFMDFLLMCFF